MITGTTIMNTPLRILFLGATGYIGGAVLDRLLEHPARHSYEIVSYSRNAEKAKKLEELFDVKTVIGTLDDSDKIEEQAALADVVIHTADSADHMGSVQAILRGTKRKFQQSGQVPIYIHTVSERECKAEFERPEHFS
jgi:nucleoside-diphosphate-sugar epimerase